MEISERGRVLKAFPAEKMMWSSFGDGGVVVVLLMKVKRAVRFVSI